MKVSVVSVKVSVVSVRGPWWFCEISLGDGCDKSFCWQEQLMSFWAVFMILTYILCTLPKHKEHIWPMWSFCVSLSLWKVTEIFIYLFLFFYLTNVHIWKRLSCRSYVGSGLMECVLRCTRAVCKATGTDIPKHCPVSTWGYEWWV